VHKLRGQAEFRAVVSQYRLLPERAARAFARLLPWLEISIATALVLLPGPVAGPMTALAFVALVCVYCAAMAINLARGRSDIACGCSGVAAQRPIGPALLLRNLMLILTALTLALPAAERALQWLDLVSITAAAIAFALVNATLEVALANAHRLSSRPAHAGAEP